MHIIYVKYINIQIKCIIYLRIAIFKIVFMGITLKTFDYEILFRIVIYLPLRRGTKGDDTTYLTLKKLIHSFTIPFLKIFIFDLISNERDLLKNSVY